MIEYNKRDVTDGSGLIAAVRAATGERYLGDLKVIDSLLRELAAGVLNRYNEACNGVLTPSQASTTDQAECLRLAGIFVGNDSNYQAVKNWTGRPIADYMRRHFANQIEVSESDVHVLSQIIALFVISIYQDVSMELAESELMQSIKSNMEALRLTLIASAVPK